MSELNKEVGDAPKVSNLVFKKASVKRKNTMENWVVKEVRHYSVPNVSHVKTSAPCAIVDKHVFSADADAHIGNHISANVAMTPTVNLTRWRMHISR